MTAYAMAACLLAYLLVCVWSQMALQQAIAGDCTRGLRRGGLRAGHAGSEAVRASLRALPAE